MVKIFNSKIKSNNCLGGVWLNADKVKIKGLNSTDVMSLQVPMINCTGQVAHGRREECGSAFFRSPVHVDFASMVELGVIHEDGMLLCCTSKV
jgi:hypothetical protein